MQAQQWKGVTGGGTLGQKLLILLFRFVPVKAMYWVLWLVTPFYMLFNRKAYKATYSYFRTQWGYAPLRALNKTYRNHIIFGQCMFDRFAVFAGKAKSFNVQFTGYEHRERFMQDKRGCVVATAHVGNFEIGGYLLGEVIQKKTITMTFGGESSVISSNREQRLNTNEMTTLSNSADMAHIFVLRNALLEGQMVTMMCDRMVGNEKRVECSFLNGKADFPQGAFALAVNTNVPMIAVFVMKETKSVYHSYSIPLEIEQSETMNRQEKIAAYAKQYVAALESVLRKYPEQWFNYYDFWKTQS
ncbi:MAG: lipid A biosynthesis (KDO)2-(lauroyl)-lipid IVA acyltransferase [Bacteroidales bacterium]|jgi:predicted LPLAT superfamily acyltransferase|nr:lipid A biosynthesis (KDO)2-(lauroyl)-lipid IVA acyltransferase [Bacteroidales bacterium]